MLQRILNAVAQRGIYRRNKFRPQRAADRITSQRQRQARHLLPPSSEIYNPVQCGLVIGQLPFMEDESSLVFALQHLRNNLVEGNDFSLDTRRKKLQR